MARLQELVYFLLHIKVSDIIDICLVFVCLNYLLQAIQGTRAIQILQGIGTLMALLLIAHLLQLQTLSWLLNWFLVSVAVVIPIIFQPELRRALMRLGQQGILSASSLGKLEKEELIPLIDELAFAAFSLAQVRHGALIVLERETGLKEFIEKGVPMDAVVTSNLLITIFNPKTPLHDGAVILRGNRVAAAACFLEAGIDQEADPRFGTRHRAALSLSAQTDCIVLVVSEETGQVRVAVDGAFSRPTEEEGAIKKLLSNLLVTSGTSRRSRLRFPIGRKLLAAEAPPRAGEHSV